MDEYARKVCERLAAHYNTSIYTTPEVVWGFARFLQLSAEIWAKYLNKEHEQTED
ncbi:MAG: hypothetical protein IT324_06245 [Anaerolineae bacterium]|nr:hypothetical protein [Anaerolineae bacterium]